MRTSFGRSLVLLSTVVCTASHASLPFFEKKTSLKKNSSETCNPGPHSMRIGVRHVENKGVGYNTGYTTLETFFSLPVGYRAVLPFIDLRGHLFDDGKWAANGGLGLRSVLGNRVYGAFAYYDYRNTKHHSYNQVSFGMETLGKWWDLRLNGYLPIGNTKSSSYHLQLDQFVGHNLFITRRYEYALSGGNGEIGAHLIRSKNFALYTAAGPYYLKGTSKGGIWGGAYRLRGSYKNWLALEANYSYDHVFKNIVQGQIAFMIPFGPRAKLQKRETSSCKQEALLYSLALQPVAKNEIIAVNHNTKKSLAIDPATGEPYSFVFVDYDSGGSLETALGTFESPFASVEDAIQASHTGDTILVVPTDETTKEFTTGTPSPSDPQANTRWWFPRPWGVFDE